MERKIKKPTTLSRHGKIYARYRKLYDIDGKRSEKIYPILAKEFDLSERSIIAIITEQRAIEKESEKEITK